MTRGGKRDSQLGHARLCRKRPADEPVPTQGAKKSRDDSADQAQLATSDSQPLRAGQRVVRVGRPTDDNDVGRAGRVRYMRGNKAKVDAEDGSQDWPIQSAANFADLGRTPTPAEALDLLVRRGFLTTQIKNVESAFDSSDDEDKNNTVQIIIGLVTGSLIIFMICSVLKVAKK